MTHNLHTDAYEEDKDRDDKVFDLVINGEDISQYVGDRGETNENRMRWTLHTTLTPNPPKDTDGRREESGRGWVRELQGK